jgi:hypothetical protein
MWIGKKKYRDLIDRIEELEAAGLLLQLCRGLFVHITQ